MSEPNAASTGLMVHNTPEKHPAFQQGDKVIVATEDAHGNPVERTGSFVKCERQWLSQTLICLVRLGSGHGLWDEAEDSSTGIWTLDSRVRPLPR